MNALETALASLLAIGIPLLFLILIYALDLYASSTFRLVLLCFAWGGLGGAGLAYLINSYVAVPLARTLRPDYLLLYVAFAPLTEEIVKSLPLFYISRQPEFTYFVDGTIYGFAVGIGFSIAENFFYLSWYPGAQIPLVMTRVFSACLMHGTATALIGAALGRFRFRRFSNRASLLIAASIVAVLVHALFNAAVVVLPTSWSLSGLLSMLSGLTGFGAVVWFVLRGLREERLWLLQSLDEAMIDLVDRELMPEEREWLAATLDDLAGVSVAEVRASQSYQVLDELLEPVARQFPDKAELLRRIVLQQAQINIKRRVRSEIANPKLRQGMTEEIDRLVAETKQLRREAGGCVMGYVQCVFGGSESDVWPCVENIVACSLAERGTEPPI
ncbi:MAG: PrsW family glutamic-type intramembrane protease [Anaerolineae bacterium]